MVGDSSTRAAIMDATFDALCEQGYANLTTQAIADEFDKSKSLIHYHYDSKDELLAAFMEHLLERFVERVEGDADAAPAERLRRMAEIVILGTDEDARDFQTALLELRAQAPYDETLQEQLVANDRRIRGLIADVVREGIDAGQFREVDPEAFAACYRAAIEGAQSHRVVHGEAAATDAAMAGVEELLVEELLVDPDDATA